MERMRLFSAPSESSAYSKDHLPSDNGRPAIAIESLRKMCGRNPSCSRWRNGLCSSYGSLAETEVATASRQHGCVSQLPS